VISQSDSDMENGYYACISKEVIAPIKMNSSVLIMSMAVSLLNLSASTNLLCSIMSCHCFDVRVVVKMGDVERMSHYLYFSNICCK
jgi:hypothetical protein